MERGMKPMQAALGVRPDGFTVISISVRRRRFHSPAVHDRIVGGCCTNRPDADVRDRHFGRRVADSDADDMRAFHQQRRRGAQVLADRIFEARSIRRGSTPSRCGSRYGTDVMFAVFVRPSC